MGNTEYDLTGRAREIFSRVSALAAITLGGVGQGLINPRLPELFKNSAHLALAASGSAAAMYLGIFVLTPVMGRLCDEGRVRTILRGGLALYALTLAAFALSPTPQWLFLLRLAEGLTLSAVYVGSEFVLSRLSNDKNRARWLSLSGVALSLGLLGGPLLALWGFHQSLLFVSLASFLVIGLMRLKDERLKGSLESLPFPRLQKGPLFAGFLYGFVEAGLVAVFAVIAVTSLKVSADKSLLAIITAALVGACAGGVFADTWGARRCTLATLTIFSLCALVASRLPAGEGFFGSGFINLSLFAALMGALYPAALAWLLNPLSPQYFGRATASFSRAYGAGALAGPLASGLGVEFGSLHGLFVVFALTGLVGVVGVSLSSYFSSSRSERRLA